MKGEHDMNNDDDDAFDEFGVLKPGRSRRVPVWAMDSLSRSIASAHGGGVCDGGPEHYARCRPGPRFGTDEQRAARELAYQQSKRVTGDAWKSPQRREQDAEAAALAAHDAVVSADDARKIRDAAWRRMVERMCSAWKNP